MSQTVNPAHTNEPNDDAKERLNRWVGVYIGLLAGLLAICNVGAGNAAKTAVQSNLAATDTWAFFQSKNIRRTFYSTSADQLELLLEVQRELPPTVRQRFSDLVAGYRKKIQELTSNRTTGEGVDELFAAAKDLESRRDTALRRDPYFDWSQALLQIAVVLASVHLIVGNLWLLRASHGLALLGIVLMFNGFCLIFKWPFLG